MQKIDKLIFKTFGQIPCLSPNRYQGFVLLNNFLERCLEKNKKYQILDAGCGSGFYARFLKEAGIIGSYLGVDLEFKEKVSHIKGNKAFKIDFEDTSPFTVRNDSKQDSKGQSSFGRTPTSRRGRKNLKNINIYFKKADLLRLDLNKKFDLILSLWTLEHLKDDLKALEILKKHLKPQGVIFLTVPSFFTWPFEFGRHGFHYYSPYQLEKLTTDCGFKIISFKKCAGPFGWLFTLCYCWLSLLVLLPILGIYKIFGRLPQRKTREDLGNAQLSRRILNKTIFAYKKTQKGREFHYNLVRLITIIDRKIPLLESSYIAVLKKNPHET